MTIKKYSGFISNAKQEKKVVEYGTPSKGASIMDRTEVSKKTLSHDKCRSPFSVEDHADNVSTILKSLDKCVLFEGFEPPQTGCKLFDFEIIKFKKRLSYFKNENLFNSREIFVSSLRDNFEFAKTIDKIKTYTMQSLLGIAGYNAPEEYDFSDVCTGYSDIFPASGLFPWEEPPSEDYLYGFLEDDISEEFISSYKEELKLMLCKKKIPLFKDKCDFEISKLSQSQNVLLSSNKNEPNMDCQYQFNISTDNMYGEIKDIFITPANTRCTCIPHFTSTNKLKKLHNVLYQITSKLPYSCMTSPERARFLMRKSQKEGLLHFLLDIRKCGITMSKKLMLATQSVLSEVYPEFTEEFGIIKQVCESVVKTPIGNVIFKRGFNLGWINEIPTIVQCVIFSMYKKTCKFPIDAIFYNDDSDIFLDVKSLERKLERTVDPTELSIFASSILEDMVNFFSNYLFLNKKKIFASYNKSVFCEIYHDNTGKVDIDKRQLIFNSFVDCLYKKNRYEARTCFYSILQNFTIPEDIQAEIFREFSEYYKPTSNKLELNYPFQCGGVNPISSKNFKRIFQYILEQDDFNLYKGYLIHDVEMIKLNRYVKIYTSSSKEELKLLETKNPKSFVPILKYQGYLDALEDRNSQKTITKYFQEEEILILEELASCFQSKKQKDYKEMGVT